MAITYPLELPTSIGIENIVLRSANIAAMSESPFTFRQQVFKHPGERWEASITIPAVNRALAEPWVAFLVALKGPQGTFRLGDPQCATARGSASVTPGTPLVNGAGQLGGSLVIDGCPLSATGYLLAGDYIQLGTTSNSRLYKVLQDVDTNGSGQATIDIWPSIRSATVDNQAVYVANAKGNFRLRSNTTEWGISFDNRYAIQFEAIEVVP